MNKSEKEPTDTEQEAGKRSVLKRFRKPRYKKQKPLPSPVSLTKSSFSFFKEHWRVIFMIGLIQLVVSAIIRLFLFQQPIEAGVYIGFIALLGTLAYIWAVRHLENDEPVNVRDAYYLGTAPLVKFILLLILILLQLLPFSIGAFIFATATLNQAASALDIIFLSSIWLILSLPSFYWLTSSVFALFVVTLPQLDPIEALRKAKELATGSRLLLFMHLFYVTIASILVLVAFLIGSAFLPGPVLQVTVLGSTFYTVQIVQYVVTTLFVTPLAAIYLYKVYKRLIKRRNEEGSSEKED